MALYAYRKHSKQTLRRTVRVISIFCIISGLLILVWVLSPIVFFEVVYAPRFTKLLQPVPDAIIQDTLASLPVIVQSERIDYTKASVWFPKATNVQISPSSTVYSLSIPKVGVYEALVTIGGEDLMKSLIHFTGPLPGQNGNPVIFGHSTLLWFYNPRDYKSIFSKLPSLTIGDSIITKVDSITYTYKVYDMNIVYPEDLSVLRQQYDNSYITLITCVPPGTYLKRLVVRAKLEKI